MNLTQRTIAAIAVASTVSVGVFPASALEQCTLDNAKPYIETIAANAPKYDEVYWESVGKLQKKPCDLRIHYQLAGAYSRGAGESSASCELAKPHVEMLIRFSDPYRGLASNYKKALEIKFPGCFGPK